MNATTNSAPAAEVAEAAPAPKDTKNGITRPKTGTATGRVWEMAEELSNAKGAAIDRAAVIEKGESEGLNKATIATQYGRWRKYHGLVGEPRAPKTAPATTENPAPPPPAGTTVES